MSPLSVMPVPVTAKVPDVIAATVTAPLLIVRLLVAVLSALVAVIVPELLRIVSGSLKV